MADDGDDLRGAPARPAHGRRGADGRKGTDGPPCSDGRTGRWRAAGARLRTAARLPGGRPGRWAVALTGTGALLAGTVAAAAPGGAPAPPRAHAAAHPSAVRPAADATCDPRRSLSPSSDLDGPALTRIRKRGQLIAGVDQNSYKWGYRDPKSGRIEGFDIEIVKAIAKAIFGKVTHHNLLLKAVSTDGRQEALNPGGGRAPKVDIVVRTMSATCGREKGAGGHPAVAFSSVYYDAGQELLVPENSKITGFNHTLADNRVCTASGSSGEKLLEKDSYDTASRIYLKNQLDCLVQLQLGNVDAVVSDNALLAGQVEQDPAVKVLTGRCPGQGGAESASNDRCKGRDPYAVAINPHNPDLVRFVNHVLADYRKGPWQEAYRTWLEPELGPGSAPRAEYRD